MNIQNKDEQKAGAATKVSTTKGQKTIERIVRSAQTLLSNEGYHAVTLGRIAKELDISKGNVTYHFPNKDALITEAVINYLDRYAVWMFNKAKEFPNDPVLQLKFHYKFFAEKARLKESRQFFYHFWALSTHDENVAKHRNRIYLAILDWTMKYLEHALPDENQQVLRQKAFLMMSVFEGLSVMFGHDEEFSKLFHNLDDYLPAQIVQIVFS